VPTGTRWASRWFKSLIADTAMVLVQIITVKERVNLKWLVAVKI